MTRRDDEDLAELLDELESTLGDLRTELEAESRRPARPRRRPPTPTEFLRFTEEYTIPTVVAMLEATVRSLELLRQVLRAANPDRSPTVEAVRAGRDGVSGTATAGLERALSELRTALSEADLPPDAESRAVVEDARELSAEIESRIREASGDRTRRDREPRRSAADEGIPIDVRDEAESAAVDVDAELRSIKDEFDDDSDA